MQKSELIIIGLIAIVFFSVKFVITRQSKEKLNKDISLLSEISNLLEDTNDEKLEESKNDFDKLILIIKHDRADELEKNTFANVTQKFKIRLMNKLDEDNLEVILKTLKEKTDTDTSKIQR